jgi:hypothetical protein
MGSKGQKWERGIKVEKSRSKESLILAFRPLGAETGRWRAKRKLQTSKAISMFLVGNCREEFVKSMNIIARQSVFVFSETSLRNVFDSP